MAGISLAEDVRILFVEDNPLDVELCRLQLERDGLHFEWRSTASRSRRARGAARVPAGYRDQRLFDARLQRARCAATCIHRPRSEAAGDRAVGLHHRRRGGGMPAGRRNGLPRKADDATPAAGRAQSAERSDRPPTLRKRASSASRTSTSSPASRERNPVAGPRCRARHPTGRSAGRALALIAFDIDGFGLLDHGFGRRPATPC